MGNKSSFTVYFTCGYLKVFLKEAEHRRLEFYYAILHHFCAKHGIQKNIHNNMHQQVARKWWMLFEIGIVWEDVDKILNHPVAEVVLLLEEETRGELSPPSGFAFVLCADTVPGSTDAKKLSACAQQIWRYLFFHLPQSEPCAVSACVNSWLSERHPGGLQLSPSPGCYWGRWRCLSDLRRHWNTKRTRSHTKKMIFAIVQLIGASRSFPI